MYEEKKFDIPELIGISAKSVEEHLKLYSGYVKNTNMILEAIKKNDPSGYALAEMQRRFAFEFGGMKNHEVYFASLEGGPKTLPDGELKASIEHLWGSFDAWLDRFKTIAKTRGVGWAMLSYDPSVQTLVNGWVDEQHLGHLPGTLPVLALDMWEHSFVHDYHPSGKGQYIEDYFANINWEVIDANFKAAIGA